MSIQIFSAAARSVTEVANIHSPITPQSEISIDTHIDSRVQARSRWLDDRYDVKVSVIKDSNDMPLFTLEKDSRDGLLRIYDKARNYLTSIDPRKEDDLAIEKPYDVVTTDQATSRPGVPDPDSGKAVLVLTDDASKIQIKISENVLGADGDSEDGNTHVEARQSSDNDFWNPKPSGDFEWVKNGVVTSNAAPLPGGGDIVGIEDNWVGW